MEPSNEQIAPELLQALITQANASGLSVNGYLARLLGLAGDRKECELALAEVPEDSQPRNEAMLAVLRRSAERLKDVPVSGSTQETLKMIEEARAGRMWGYEPVE